MAGGMLLFFKRRGWLRGERLPELPEENEGGRQKGEGGRTKAER
jgi:hypothetical protein